MVRISKDVVDQTAKEMLEYERKNWGAKNGELYALFATVVSSTEAFKQCLFTLTMLGGLSLGPFISGLKEKKENEKPDNVLEFVSEGNPLAPMVMDAMYLAFELGRKEDVEKRVAPIPTSDDIVQCLGTLQSRLRGRSLGSDEAIKIRDGIGELLREIEIVTDPRVQKERP